MGAPLVSPLMISSCCVKWMVAVIRHLAARRTLTGTAARVTIIGKNMIEEIETAHKVLPILRAIADGSSGITHVGTTRTTKPQDHECWLIRVKTADGHEVEFWMEGSVVHCVTEFKTGGMLVFESNHINILPALGSETINALTVAIMAAFTHVLTA